MFTGRLRSLWPQWLAAGAATLVVLQLGATGGWSSPSLAKLTSSDSPLRINLDEASWVASVMNLGRMIGAVAGGISAYVCGSKTSLLLTCLPLAASWILIGVANSVAWLYAARVLGGVGMGMAFSCFPLYIGEISDPSIRGSLVSIALCGAAMGNLMASVVGAHFDLHTASLIYLAPCVAAIGLFAWLPESPHHLTRLEDPQRAKAAIRWYDRGCDVDAAYSALKKFVEVANSQTFLEKMAEFRRPEMRKALFIVVTLFMYMQMCGLNNVIFYMEMILIDAKSTIIAPSTTVIIMSSVAVFASAISTYMIESFGRRILLITSSIGISVSLVILEIHFTLLDSGYDPAELEYLPIVSLIVFQLNAFAGIMTVPSTVLSEIFPPAIKCLAACTASVGGAIFAFICSKTFQPLLDAVGQKYVYWIYIAIILSAVPFAVLCMPETKGKSLQEIQDDITKNK